MLQKKSGQDHSENITVKKQERFGWKEIKHMKQINYQKLLKHILLCGTGMLLAGGMSVNVFAAETNVHFGSESYHYEMETFPVGVYVEADEPIGTYSVCVEYDPEVLEYDSGGDSHTEGKVYIDGGNGSESIKRMLYFNPIKEEATELSLSEIIVTSDSGERYEITSDGPVSVSLGEAIAQPEEEQPEETPEQEPEQEKEQNEQTTETMESQEPEQEKTSDSALVQKAKSVLDQLPGNKLIYVIACLILLGVIIAAIIVIDIRAIRRRRRRRQRVQERQKQRQQLMHNLTDERKVKVQKQTVKKDPDVVISVQDVCMYFKIALDAADSLKEYLIRSLKHQNKYKELKALDHISFDVHQGEVVGIIGTNGSGKSTLLKIVSGAMAPTSGKVVADKKKIQLLTLGTGFDRELTARENVYLNGAIIGYTKEYIDEKYDEIVKFAELEGFMEERVKNFSSGMVSRLGFAIATMRDTPDILILDEVLSVGDMFFRQKSNKRIQEMIHSGATVLIVSHSTDTILKNCTKAVWIEKGVQKMVGDPKTVCAAYKAYGQGER